MEGYLITLNGYEGIEITVGLFTKEEAIARMTRFRVGQFITTHYEKRPSGAGESLDVFDWEPKVNYSLWTTEDQLQEKLDNQIWWNPGLSPEEDEAHFRSKGMSDEEIQYQRKLSSPEYNIKRITNGFCVSLVNEQGAECVCKELGFGLDEMFITD